MNTDIDITLATNYDDWEGLYVNGTLFTEGHRISIEDFAKSIGVKFITKEAGPWLYDRGSLPELEDEFDQFNK